MSFPTTKSAFSVLFCLKLAKSVNKLTIHSLHAIKVNGWLVDL